MTLAVSQVAGAGLAVLGLPLPLAQEASDPSFWDDHGDEISAAITMLVAIVVAFLVDRLVIGRGVRAAERPGAGLFAEALRERFAARGLDVPFVEYRLPGGERTPTVP